jgi:hypothetical protein
VGKGGWLHVTLVLLPFEQLLVFVAEFLFDNPLDLLLQRQSIGIWCLGLGIQRHRKVLLVQKHLPGNLLVGLPGAVCLHSKPPKHDSYHSTERAAAHQIEDLMGVDLLANLDADGIDK